VMQAMSVTKKMRKAVMRIQNVPLPVNGPIGVNGVTVHHRVKMVCESEDEPITKMTVQHVTVLVLSPSVVPTSNPRNVPPVSTTMKNVTKFQPVSALISDIQPSWSDFVTNIVATVPSVENDLSLIAFQERMILLFSNF
jgi:hypothetical protein